MSKDQISNRNQLIGSQFTFNIQKLKHFNHFVQAITLPDLSINPKEVSTPFSSYFVPGDHLVYGELTVEYGIQETLENYYEIINWMIGQGFPENYDQYKSLKDGTDLDLNGQSNKNLINNGRVGGNIYSDATLIVNSSHNNGQVKFEYVDLFPIRVSSITLKYTNSKTEYLTQSVTFRYDRFKLSKV